MNKYIRSNMIMESSYIEKIKTSLRTNEKRYSEESFGSIKVCRIDVVGNDQTEYGEGRYITVYTPKLWLIDDEDIDDVSNVLSKELKRILEHTNKGELRRVLIAGVGNRRISSDSLGPLTVEKISVTRHVEIIDSPAFKASGLCSVCAVSCGVMGDTGVGSAEMLRGLVSEVRPDVVIAVDALAAKAPERLGATVQISDTGISPGAGIGNRQSSINCDTIGVPVIALGVPTVVSASTLIADVLRRYTKIKIDEELDNFIKERKNFFVAPKECDVVSDRAAVVLARAIDKAMGVIRK